MHTTITNVARHHEPREAKPALSVFYSDDRPVRYPDIHRDATIAVRQAMQHAELERMRAKGLKVGRRPKAAPQA